jgi:hypothetical protein
MDGPGQDGVASAIQPSLQFHLQSKRQLVSIELLAEYELRPPEALQIAAIGAFIDQSPRSPACTRRVGRR